MLRLNVRQLIDSISIYLENNGSQTESKLKGEMDKLYKKEISPVTFSNALRLGTETKLFSKTKKRLNRDNLKFYNVYEVKQPKEKDPNPAAFISLLMKQIAENNKLPSELKANITTCYLKLLFLYIGYTIFTSEFSKSSSHKTKDIESPEIMKALDKLKKKDTYTYNIALDTFNSEIKEVISLARKFHYFSDVVKVTTQSLEKTDRGMLDTVLELIKPYEQLLESYHDEETANRVSDSINPEPNPEGKPV